MGLLIWDRCAVKHTYSRTPDEDRILKQEYAAGDLEELAERLGVTTVAVMKRARKLDLHRNAVINRNNDPTRVPGFDQVPLSERRRIIKEKYVVKSMVRPSDDEEYMQKVKAELRG